MRDRDFNYDELGYKFLGWQNGWEYDHKDNVAYVKKGQHPEYDTCKELGHKTAEVSLSDRGSENIVSCDKCMIYYKYDCSD